MHCKPCAESSDILDKSFAVSLLLLAIYTMIVNGKLSFWISVIAVLVVISE